MSSKLKSEFIRRPLLVSGFSGAGALVEDCGDQLLIVAATADVLRDKIQKLMPEIDSTSFNTLPVTVIQAK